MTKEFWNERYSLGEYVYGTEPNVFFSEEISKIKPGKLLLPCEGEGRNAVFAASHGWDVTAFDQSEVAKEKCLKLAGTLAPQIKYSILNAESLPYQNQSFDCIALIYSHFPASSRKQIHQQLIKMLKPNGRIFLEAYQPKQLGLASGGPKEPNMLYTIKNLKDDFSELKIVSMNYETIQLNEGPFHKGKAEVIRMVADKA
jgi:ubiquinone/menaquinone biosynthesis C-methylase UbiE